MIEIRSSEGFSAEVDGWVRAGIAINQELERIGGEWACKGTDVAEDGSAKQVWYNSRGKLITFWIT